MFTQTFISKIPPLILRGVIILEGIITSGLGEGSIFMSMEHYKKEIKNKLGFDAYHGTLNLKIKEEQLISFKKFNPIKIEGCKKNNKAFYGARCYKASIKNINGAVIIPDINKHKKDIIEFIAPINLKSELGIKDGDKISLKLLK